MTNEKKADEIAGDMLPYNNAEYHACYNSAMKAMQWKDERANLCFMMIAKLIKDVVLTKDCTEHIMVQQMIELYRNLKMQ